MAQDKLTKTQVNIDFEHYKVHRGEMYSVNYYTTVTAASSTDLMINTGVGHPHVKIAAVVSGQALVSLYEGITTSANGTKVNVFNMDRDSTKSCAALFFHTPTWSTNTEVLLAADLMVGGDKKNSMIGSASRDRSEWVLEDATKYLVRVTNQAAATIGASINIQFYELEV